MDFWELETTSVCSHICRPITPASPMNCTAPEQEVGRRSNPCRGLSCEHLDSNIFMSLTFSKFLKSHRSTTLGFLRFATSVATFCVRCCISVADRSLLWWSRTHHLVPLLRIKSCSTLKCNSTLRYNLVCSLYVDNFKEAFL